MTNPTVGAVAVMLFGFAALFLFGAAPKWVDLAKDRQRSNERPSIPITKFRSAAILTALAFGTLGVAILWSVASYLVFADR